MMENRARFSFECVTKSHLVKNLDKKIQWNKTLIKEKKVQRVVTSLMTISLELCFKYINHIHYMHIKFHALSG